MRFAAKCEVAAEEHTSTIVLGGGEGIPNRDYGRPAVELLDADLDGDADLERLRIEAGTPRFGREIDDRILPAEAGLDERAISFTKGCYPGQEPVARQHYRGKVNRRLRVLELDGAPDPETPVVFNGKEVGRVTSAVPGLALAYVRVEVPDGAVVDAGGPARIR
jgi:aminomethyltransferase